MRSWTVIFLGLVVLVIPVFFLGLFVMSVYYQLVFLRDRCRRAHAELDREASEEQKTIARAAYNRWVGDYNTARQKFPTNVVAVIFRFPPAEPLNR